MHTYMAYPDESELFNKEDIIQEILESQRANLEKNHPFATFDDNFLEANIKALRIDGMNVLISPLPNQYILGLVFDLETNPYDYKNELIRLLLEYFLNKFVDTDKDKIKTNLLLTLFIDIRKYSDESLVFQKVQNQVIVINNTPMIKIFVYGIDNAGKSSLMRLLATGKYDHDFFPPTKKFRITNVKLKSGVKLVAWDMPGQLIFRQDWLRGAQASNILLFMLDSFDRVRYEEAKREFWNIVNLYELQGLPIIFLVNKIDLLEEPPTEEEIKEYFNLKHCADRDLKVLFTSLPNRIGIDLLENWLEQQANELLITNGIVPPQQSS